VEGCFDVFRPPKIQERHLAEKEAVCCSSPTKDCLPSLGPSQFSVSVRQSEDPLPRGLNHARVLLGV